MFRARISHLAFLSLVAACSGRARDGAFVPCGDADPPAARTTSVAGVSLAVTGRNVSLTSTTSDLRVAVFSGAAPFATHLEDGKACLMAARPDVVVVLGDLGDAAAHVARLVRELATLERLALLLPGGRDDPSFLNAAISDLDEASRSRVLSLAGVTTLKVGEATWFPVAGGPVTWVSSARACGFDDGVLTRRLEAIGLSDTQGGTLLSWLAPSAEGLSLTGAAGGDESLRRLATRLGVTRAIAAVPSFSSGQRVHDVVLAPRLVGARPSLRNGDFGARGFVLVTGASERVVECP